MSKKEKSCENCKYGEWVEENCTTLREPRKDCIDSDLAYWEPEEIETTIDAQWLATEVARSIYNQGKAKVFNVMESQLEPGPKLSASKKVMQDIISGIAKNASNLVQDTLEDWEITVLIPAESGLSEEDEEKVSREYEDAEKVIGVRRSLELSIHDIANLMGEDEE